MLSVSVRESKLVIERLLLVTGLDIGLVPSVREIIVSAELVGANGFGFLRDEFTTDIRLPEPSLQIVEKHEHMQILDGQDQYAAVLGPKVLNLIWLGVRRHGTTALMVHNVRRPEIFQGLVPLTNRHRIACVVVNGAGDSATTALGLGDASDPALAGSLAFSHSPSAVPFGANGHLTDTSSPDVSGSPLRDSCLIFATDGQSISDSSTDVSGEALGSEHWRAQVDGIAVDDDVWWALYHRSREALAKTSQVSRTHAGPSIEKLFVEW